MTSKLSGPHFCIGTARNISDRIFRDLIKRAEAAGGQLTLDEIERLSVSFNGRISENTQIFERVYEDCVSTHRGKASRVFSRKTLPAFVVFAYTIDLMKAAFAAQGERGSTGWYTNLAAAFIVVVRDDTGLDVAAVANRVYDRLSLERGQALTADDVVTAPEIADAIGQLIAHLRASTHEGSDTDRICNAINTVLHSELHLVGPSPLLVNNIQFRDFVRRLGIHKFQNSYRKAIYLGEADHSACA